MALVLFDVGAMDADNVADLAHYGALFEAVRVDDHDGVINIRGAIVAHGANRAVDDLERADPLALVALHWVGGIDDDTVNVHCFSVFGVERAVPGLSKMEMPGG